MSGSDFAVMDVATVSLVLLLNLGRAGASGLAESSIDRGGLVRGGGLGEGYSFASDERLEVFEKAQ
jgi:hypothetical protein